MRALAEGTAIFRATAADGTTATYSLPTRVAVASGVAYPGNAEFGEPADGDASDDFIVRHEQFTASYNPNRGSPNWVSYDLDAAHFGAGGPLRLLHDGSGPAGDVAADTTEDYTDAGAFHGYGIDRGHMVRSFDRTTGSLDNARTYLFSNVVPQASDMNQGPWANLENDLGDLARVQGREVYIITGPAGNRGTLKNEGRVVIPDVDLEGRGDPAARCGAREHRRLPRSRSDRGEHAERCRHPQRGLEYLSHDGRCDRSADRLRPARAAARRRRGRGRVQHAAAARGDRGPRRGDRRGRHGLIQTPPRSLDPNGTMASYDWDFGDGTTGSGVTVTHTFVQDGAFTVRVTVTDNDGLTDSATFTVNVTNVAPVVGAVPNAIAECRRDVHRGRHVHRSGCGRLDGDRELG